MLCSSDAFYAHAGIRYKNVNPERLSASNQHLLWCNADGIAKAG